MNICGPKVYELQLLQESNLILPHMSFFFKVGKLLLKAHVLYHGWLPFSRASLAFLDEV